MTDRIRLNEDNRKWWTLAAMCFALFMVMLDNTVVNVALPSIQRDRHVGGRVRLGAGDRSGRWWRTHGVRLVARDLLPQPARRRRRSGGHAVRRAQLARRDRRALDRLPRHRGADRGADRSDPRAD